MKKMITVVVAAIAATVFGGYGDLPDTFDASTGYVTLDTADTAGAEGHSSLYDGTNGADRYAPHAHTNYYCGKNFMTPRLASDIEAQLAIDPTALTFKGDVLVVNGTWIYPQSQTYAFNIPDLRMLPNAGFYWAAAWAPLRGTMTTYGTAALPVRFNYSMDRTRIRQEFGMNIKGDVDSYLAVMCPLVMSGTTTARPGYFAFTGDLSDFHGTFKVRSTMNPGGTTHIEPFGIELASTAPDAAVVLETQGALYAAAPEGVAIRSLEVAGSNTILRINAANLSPTEPRLSISNNVALNGRKVSIALQTHTLPATGNPIYTFKHVNPNPAADAPLLRLGPDAVANGGFGDPYETFVWAITETKAMTEWTSDNDGGMTLWRWSYVTNLCADAQNRPSMTNATNSTENYHWSDSSAPSSSKRYFSTFKMEVPKASSTEAFAFPGRSLTIWNGGGSANVNLNMLNGGYGFYCSNLVLRGATLNMCNADVKDPVVYDENASQYRIYRVAGRITVPYGTSNTLQSYGDVKLLMVDAEVVGGGNLVCGSYLSSSYTNDRGYHWFTAMNTNFTGKISVTMPYSAKAANGTAYGLTVPNWTQRSRLFVSDERNLGGRRETFAYDALLLEHYSDLFPLGDVTFTDGWNRGIAIGDIGRMHVTNGLTLTILRPLNVNGNLVKEGAGTLALGGTLTFNGATQSATPTANKNLLTVMGGAIKPLAAHAFDGLAITFTNNASIKLDATVVAEGLRDYGIVNVKETTAPFALAANQSVIPVTVTPPEYGIARFTTAICTVDSAAAENLPVSAFEVSCTDRRRACEVRKRTNADGSVTYLADCTTQGLAITFK